MDPETTRRSFLHGGALAAAGVLAGTATQAVQGQEKPAEHKHDAKSDREFPRDHPGSSGPVGSP